VLDIPLIDISDEDTVPYIEHFNPYDPIEVIDLEPQDQVNEIPLEPLDPDAEYQQNIQRLFFTLDEYARNTFHNLRNN